MKFEVLNGKHCERSGNGKGNVNYEAGDVLESPRPLDKMFLNKFRRVSKDTPVSNIPAKNIKPDIEEEALPEDEDIEEEAPKKRGRRKKKQRFVAKRIKDSDLWNVRDSETDEKMNKKPLSKEDAKDMEADLNG